VYSLAQCSLSDKYATVGPVSGGPALPSGRLLNFVTAWLTTPSNARPARQAVPRVRPG
jgi:hypothetical protein